MTNWKLEAKKLIETLVKINMTIIAMFYNIAFCFASVCEYHFANQQFRWFQGIHFWFSSHTFE